MVAEENLTGTTGLTGLSASCRSQCTGYMRLPKATRLCLCNSGYSRLEMATNMGFARQCQGSSATLAKERGSAKKLHTVVSWSPEAGKLSAKAQSFLFFLAFYDENPGFSLKDSPRSFRSDHRIPQSFHSWLSRYTYTNSQVLAPHGMGGANKGPPMTELGALVRSNSGTHAPVPFPFQDQDPHYPRYLSDRGL